MASLNPKVLIRRGIRRLPFGLLYEIFYQSGRALGITGYEVAGRTGTFVGPFEDQSVIKQYLKHGTFSPVIAKLFTDFFTVRGGGTFYDLGANLGLVTVPIAQMPSVRCLAFEPDPRNFALLRGNVLANCAHGNVEIVNAAVAQDHGELGFTESRYNCGDHHLAIDGALRVRAVPLDDYPPSARPLAVKIDCQDAEPAIIAGGARTLAQAELIAMEFWPYRMRRAGLSPKPILEFAADAFPFAEVLHHNQPPGAPLPIADALPLLQRMIDDGGWLTQADLVLTRS
jgi:FkbM family methyltransferase